MSRCGQPAVYAFRSVGLPAAVDFTPYWAASTAQYNDHLAYLCVFNSLNRRPVDATLIHTDTVFFRNIATGGNTQFPNRS